MGVVVGVVVVVTIFAAFNVILRSIYIVFAVVVVKVTPVELGRERLFPAVVFGVASNLTDDQLDELFSHQRYSP